MAILTIGAVSASDNDNVTSDSLMISDDAPDVISDDGDKQKPKIYFGSYSSEFYVTDDPSLWVEFCDEDISGTVAVKVDDVEKVNKTASCGYVDFDLNEFGSDFEYNVPYNLSLVYSGDAKYKSWNTTDTFTLNYIKFDEFSDLSIDTQQWATVNLPVDAKGKVSLYFDGKLYDTVNVNNGEGSIWLKDLEYGIHDYEFRYSGDKKYPAQNKSGIANVSYYLDVDINDGEMFCWGNEILLTINTPGACDEMILNQNGEIKKIALDEDGIALYSLEDLKYGENKLIFNYPGDYRYPARSIARTVYVIENTECPGEIGYSSGKGISIRLPSDAKGDIIILENDAPIASSELTEGIVNVDLSLLEMGHHNITINYTADDYKIYFDNYSFNIIPYINYTKSININEDNSISISLPSDADGYFAVNYNDGLIGNESIINGKARIPLNLEIGEYQTIVATYTSSRYGNYTYDGLINVRSQPREIPAILILADTIVFDSTSVVTFEIADSAEGTLNVSIADKKFELPVEYGIASISSDDLVQDLAFGNYTLKVSYSGDEYYYPKSNETNVSVSFISIHVLNEYEIGYNNHIFIHQSEDASAFVELYIDGKYVKAASPIEDDESTTSIDISDLDFGEYKNVELKFPATGKYEAFTKKCSFNVSYFMEIVGDECVYGNPVKILINCYGGINGEGTLSINNKDYTVKLKKGHGKIEIPNLEIGKYNATFTYEGDSVYPKKIVSDEIEVIPSINIKEVYEICDDMNVSLTLPGDAKGNLSVIIKDKDYNIILNKTTSLNNGMAIIPINELKLGEYHIESYYTGDDFRVDELYEKISVEMRIERDKNNLLIEMPDNASGTITLIIYDGTYNAFLTKEFGLTNGKLNLPVNEYLPDAYYAEIIYNGSDYGNYSKSIYLEDFKLTPSINITVPDEIIANFPAKLKFTLPKDLMGDVWVSIGDDYFYGIVEDGKAIVEIIPPLKGIRLIYYGFIGDEKYASCYDYEYITVLKTPTIVAKNLKMYYKDGSIFKVKVYDSFDKLVVGEYVDFYINGKFVKSVKTNKNGVAKLKITKVPNKYQITVKYKGAVVTKKLTVKHLLSLKSIKVKKSSRKLILTAKLKKGKKALKNKKITFKFNGKKYTAKTNKKGIAKVTIKKNVLKKLKVGRIVKYQASYIKDTVKKSTVVRK
ncbi:hypothetical protein [Methanobrevibacter sp.]|uniref:hypothetical protein n=1 Tax=Methanobrevibacter sp. TaxID=66852 RepID=UPI00388F7855